MEKRNTERIKELLVFMRNGLAFAFSWLVICVIIVSLLAGNEAITVRFLIKVFVLCLWGVIAFVVSFKNEKVQKKGFMFSLTLFYILFIPVEIAMFYLMGIFVNKGNLGVWLIFGVIVVAAYVISLLIDTIIMKRDAKVYTEKMNEYIRNQKS